MLSAEKGEGWEKGRFQKLPSTGDTKYKAVARWERSGLEMLCKPWDQMTGPRK